MSARTVVVNVEDMTLAELRAQAAIQRRRGDELHAFELEHFAGVVEGVGVDSFSAMSDEQLIDMAVRSIGLEKVRGGKRQRLRKIASDLLSKRLDVDYRDDLVCDDLRRAAAALERAGEVLERRAAEAEALVARAEQEAERHDVS